MKVTMSTLIEQSTVKSHISLNVANLPASIEFYRVLFDSEPCKCHDDYAKFELETPPVVFSLQPGPRPPGASLSHIGLRFTSPDAVVAIQDRLQAAGIPFSRQEGVVCGYARQSKCWVSDPDNNYWEIYVLEVDVDPGLVRAACLTKLVPGDILNCDDSECDAADEDAVDARTARHHVLYRGPFREVTDSAGRVYRRGCRKPISQRTFDELRRGSLAEHFSFAVKGASGTCGGEHRSEQY